MIILESTITRAVLSDIMMGKNDIFHNGTGEKGTSRFCLKGVGERMDKEGIPKTDWYREASKTKEL